MRRALVQGNISKQEMLTRIGKIPEKLSIFCCAKQSPHWRKIESTIINNK